MSPDSDSPRLQARQIAADVDAAFASARGRAALRAWREEFEQEVEEYGRRFDEAEAALDKARQAAVKEYKGFLLGKCKRRLTNPEKSPKDGLEWIKCVAEIPVSTSIDRPQPGVAQVMECHAIGMWAPPEAARRKREGAEPPPWRNPDPRREPSLAVMAMVLALLHDRVLPETRKLLGLPDADSEAIKFLRGECRFDDWEGYTSVDEVFNPSEPYGRWRLDTIKSFWNHVNAYLAEGATAAAGRPVVEPGNAVVGQSQGGGKAKERLKRGAKQTRDAKKDKQIYETRKARNLSYPELAREFFRDSSKTREVAKAIDSHRHRLRRMGK
jgi:hypothetical protein